MLAPSDRSESIQNECSNLFKERLESGGCRESRVVCLRVSLAVSNGLRPTTYPYNTSVDWHSRGFIILVFHQD